MSTADLSAARGPVAGETVLAPLGTAGRGAEASGTAAWLLAAAGLLVLGPFLAAVAVLRAAHPGIFPWGASRLDPANAAVSALVLIGAGTLTALGAAWARRGSRRWGGALLAAALLLGLAFLGLRYHESMGLLEQGLAWGDGFKPVVTEQAREASTAPNLPPVAGPAPVATVANRDATTLPAPAPAPAGLAGHPGAGPASHMPAHAGLFFGLVHLTGLAAALLVLGALVGTLRGLFSLRRSTGELHHHTAPAGALLAWQLALVLWVFAVALLYVGG